MIRKFSLLTLLLSLVLSACQSPVAPTSTPTPTHTITPSQTPTVPAPTDTPQPEPTDSQIVIAESDYLLSGSLEVGYANALVWSAASDLLAVLAQSEVTIVSVPELEKVSHFAVQDPNLILDVSTDMQTVAISEGFENILLADLTSGEAICSIAEGRFMGASFSVDGLQLAVASGEEWLVNIYAVDTCALTQTLTGFETAAPIYSAGFTPDPKLIAWFARGTLQFQSVEDNTLYPALHHEDFINTFTVAQSDPVAGVSAAGLVDGEYTPLLILWNLVTGAEIFKFPLPQPAYSLAFYPGTSHKIAIGMNEEIWILDILTAYTPLHSLTGNTGGIASLAYSPDGQWLASIGADNQLMLWAVSDD